ncbi:ClpP/crotonase-like domain-containing protein [Apiospora rasikravindrae]|uniref:ClpP/crotonase-like domain-containing protein n=1 Tax=Apiospora rasikravindrae TaxID=990691 RepID=A0ABR1RPC0_9PEZI
MTSPSHPLSYNDYPLPQVKLSHYPASAPVPTPVILVILNRPEANNAFTDTMVTSLVTAFDLLSTDPRVKAIVFTGGDPRNRIFCPGMDLDGASKNTSSSSSSSPRPEDLAMQREAHRDGGAQVSLAIHRCQKPVVAALNGHAVGVGITMTLACAARITHAGAKIGFVFARRGINMEGCSSFFLPRILGPGRALTLVTTGATYAAADPAVRDLFAEVLDEPAEVLPRAVALAEEIAGKTSAVATKAMRDMLYHGPATPEEAERLESRVFFDLFRGADAREGIRSFLEKREPRFEARWETDKPAVWPWWEGKKETATETPENGGSLMGWLKSKL